MRVKYLFVKLLFLPSIICFNERESFWSIIEDLFEDYPIDQAVTSGRGPSVTYPDTNDYLNHPVCGNIPLKVYWGICYCGSEAMSGDNDLVWGDVFCCVSPEDECYEEGNVVKCPTGTKQLKSQPCHGQCYNSYTTSQYLWRTASLYCEEDDFCLPLPQMCSGLCKKEEDVCSSDLRCPLHGYEALSFLTNYTVQSLGGKVTGNHEYCLAINNDGFYDSVSRSDEDKVTTKYTKLFEYTDLKTCHHKDAGEGIQCQEGPEGCMPRTNWCSGLGRVCTTEAGPVGMDNVDLCQNNTFWLERSCDFYDRGRGELLGVGTRCSADKKHCSFPWYAVQFAYPILFPRCLDRSDQAFPVNTSCAEFNHQFLDTYKKLWCNEGGTGTACDYIKEKLEYYKDDNRLRDPNGCEKSCITSGADCLACQHEDYFHCQSTGICIHQSNVCDGHPHPQCGGDDEIMDECYQTYFNRRIVRNYATFICDSVMYPGKVLFICT